MACYSPERRFCGKCGKPLIWVDYGYPYNTGGAISFDMETGEKIKTEILVCSELHRKAKNPFLCLFAWATAQDITHTGGETRNVRIAAKSSEAKR
jgi:hypothetical protein